MRFIKLVEQRELLNARTAVCRPQVDNHRLALSGAYREFLSAETLYLKVRKSVSFLETDGDNDFLGRLRLLLRYGRLRGLYRRLRLFQRRVKEIEPYQRERETGKCDPPERSGDDLSLLLRAGLVTGTAALRRFQSDASRLYGDSFLRTDLHTFAAVDALMVTDASYIHLTVPYTGSAAVAAVLVHLNAYDVEPVEQTVYSAERADKAAESAEAEYARNAYYQHYHEFAREENVQHTEVVRVVRICEEHHRTLGGTRRTDVFAEARYRGPVHYAVPQRDAENEHRRDYIFEIRKRTGHPALGYFRGRYLMQELLYKTERAEKAADRSSENDAVKQQYSEHIESRSLSRISKSVLERSQRAGTYRTGAGIAVEARYAGIF